eukprot:jgi/Tetstr1/465939/TSEL_010553.t1
MLQRELSRSREAMPTAVTARLSATGGRVRSDATAAARAAPVPVPGRRPAATGSFAAARARSGAQRCTGAVGLRRSAAPRQVMTAASFSAALIFDCDGVIVETEELHRLAYNASFEHFGLTVHGQPVVWTVGYYDVLQNTVGGGKPKMRYHFNTTCDGAWPTTKDGFAPATEEERTSLIDDLQDKKTEFYKKIVEEVAAARPGVLALMDEALDNPEVGVAICSAATKAGFDKVVNAIVGPERLSRFDLVLAGDDVHKKKPDPLIYNMASASLGVAPEDCLVVEDSLVGLRAAVGAGMPCLITYHKSTEGQPFVEEGAAGVLPALAGDGFTIGMENLFARNADGELKPSLSLGDAASVAA